MLFYLDGVERIRDGVAFNGGEADFKWRWIALNLILIIFLTVDGNPASVSALVLDLAYLRPMVEEKERGPVLARTVLKDK